MAGQSKRLLTEEGGLARGGKAAKMEPEPSGLHPLLIDHVLESVFKYIIWAKKGEGEPEKTVKNLRLVCRQWKEIATRIYRERRAPIVFGSFCGMAKAPSKKMEMFLEAMKGSEMIPVQRFVFTKHFFKKDNQQLLKDFLWICGPSAVELHIRLYHPTMTFTRRSFPELDLKKLKKLTLNCENYWGSHDVRNLIEVVLGAAEELKEFQFEFSSRDAKWGKNEINHFGEFVCGRIPKTVTVLGLNVPLNDSSLKTLMKSELKLEQFRLDCQWVKNGKILRDLFEKMAKTLMVLEVVNGDERNPLTVTLDLPRFPELLHLELQGANIQKISFPETFPKLVSLNIAKWTNESSCLELLSGKKGLSLEEIWLPSRFNQAPLVKKAAQFFPNISKLHVSQSRDIKDALKEVFIYFASVEELHISFPYWRDYVINADVIFSGVSKRTYGRVITYHPDFDVELKDRQRHPSLLNMTRLKKLVIEDTDSNLILTDFAAHYVFLWMDNLKEIHTMQNQMSPKYVELLREKLILKLDDDIQACSCCHEWDD